MEGGENKTVSWVKCEGWRRVGGVFANPSTSGFYWDAEAAKIMFFTRQAFLGYKLPSSHSVKAIGGGHFVLPLKTTQLTPPHPGNPPFPHSAVKCPFLPVIHQQTTTCRQNVLSSINNCIYTQLINQTSAPAEHMKKDPRINEKLESKEFVVRYWR